MLGYFGERLAAKIENIRHVSLVILEKFTAREGVRVAIMFE